MDRATFIETLHAGRAEWEALLAEVGEARMLQPGAAQRDRPLHDVLTEERQVYAQFVEQVQALPDEDFTDARRFREMPEQWLPWQVLGWADGLSRAAELAPDRRNGGYSRRYLSASLETYLRI